jgi:hypothetical protein
MLLLMPRYEAILLILNTSTYAYYIDINITCAYYINIAYISCYMSICISDKPYMLLLKPSYEAIVLIINTALWWGPQCLTNLS